MREFHISRSCRDRYGFDDSLFSLSGNVIFANFHAARVFAQKINQNRDLINYPEQAVRAGQINAMGLIDEILHLVLDLYRSEVDPQVMQDAYHWLEDRMGSDEVDRVLRLFTAEFPPVIVYRNEQSVDEYLHGETNGIPNQIVALEELIMLWIANKNPAFQPFQDLFDDRALSANTGYLQAIQELRSYFADQPYFGPDLQPIIDMLRSPAIEVPHSLSGQLEFIRERWGDLLGQYLYRLLSSLDLVKEEERMRFAGPGPIPIPVYGQSALDYEPEVERFSEDREWMARLVLIAKNSYVWLDQLSQKYQKPIRKLDDIPEEELRYLADAGFTGLWLIGLWERSEASARIKQLGGNAEAIASAYSIASYQIASDLGGERAYQGLRDKAWKYGIRLASDMVPNHMGIDSSWVLEHPDWFVALDYSPFPSYSFTGPDLSPDSRVSIFLEDHYYTRSDAAVVFKRVDNGSGAAQYIYHGNDGTSMPWNDTAQLNYLNSVVREAVIQTILEVARRFPIIRFDAAMTLAKKHYQRLWFPEPGTGGAIPSRSEHSLSKEQFDALMPIEFWREVVDRVAVEAPDTLLLAEAFWLMEGYFVRTLGMHRVYNSAFMNMLRNEDNANYRLVMKNTLEFDPEIMRRYVNFMNNPDERTAVDQFGKGDKYFGVATLMATLPGLPMFGHGQVEGYAEKYGMEFKRAYWDESPDPYLVERHRREIFPLLHRRPVFAGVQNFLLYDFFTPDGQVNEDVYAYSNSLGNDHSLVVYNNRFAQAQGWVRMSAGFAQKGPGEEKQIIQRSLGEGLGLHNEPDWFVIFRDSISNLEFILPSETIFNQGMFFDLGAYKYHVFLDFREIQDDDVHSYRHLAEYIGSRGVPSVEQAIKELMLAPVQEPFRQIANKGYFQYLLDNRLGPQQENVPANLLEEARQKMSAFVSGIERLTGYSYHPDDIVKEVQQILETVLKMRSLEEHFPVPGGQKYAAAVEFLQTGLEHNRPNWLTLLSWVFVHNIGKLAGPDEYWVQSQSWLEEWQLSRNLTALAQEFELDQTASWRMVNTLYLLISQQDWYADLSGESVLEIAKTWLADLDVQRYLGVNRFKDVLWFNKEAFETFAWWMMVVAVLKTGKAGGSSASQFAEQMLGAHEIIQTLLEAVDHSGYQVNRLLDQLAE